MAEWIANSEPSLSKMLGDLRQLWGQSKYLIVSARAGKTRSIPQNAIQHAWYTQMALEDRSLSQIEHVRFCKYTYGIPILCADEPEYREKCRRLLGPLDYECRMEAMDHWPVTRLMTKAQESSYLEAVQSGYAKRGVNLEFPNVVAK